MAATSTTENSNLQPATALSDMQRLALGQSVGILKGILGGRVGVGEWVVLIQRQKIVIFIRAEVSSENRNK